MIKKKYIIYSHFVDKRNWKDKWNNKIKLIKIANKEMPLFILQNLYKYKKWIA